MNSNRRVCRRLRLSKEALQEYDVEPSVELAADLPEVGDAGKPRRLEQGDDGCRLAAASADERIETGFSRRWPAR